MLDRDQNKYRKNTVGVERYTTRSRAMSAVATGRCHDVAFVALLT